MLYSKYAKIVMIFVCRRKTVKSSIFRRLFLNHSFPRMVLNSVTTGETMSSVILLVAREKKVHDVFEIGVAAFDVGQVVFWAGNVAQSPMQRAHVPTSDGVNNGASIH